MVHLLAFHQEPGKSVARANVPEEGEAFVPCNKASLASGMVFVCTQPSETAELVEKLEDAQMGLGSMASNRFAVPFRDEVTAWLGKLGMVGEQVIIPYMH